MVGIEWERLETMPARLRLASAAFRGIGAMSEYRTYHVEESSAVCTSLLLFRNSVVVVIFSSSPSSGLDTDDEEGAFSLISSSFPSSNGNAASSTLSIFVVATILPWLAAWMSVCLGKTISLRVGNVNDAKPSNFLSSGDMSEGDAVVVGERVGAAGDSVGEAVKNFICMSLRLVKASLSPSSIATSLHFDTQVLAELQYSDPVPQYPISDRHHAISPPLPTPAPSSSSQGSPEQ
mmetsp:Transcript_15609/g.37491  ORF Transcript_15609/g.37491 Transcript_15609/m.37491 type:complete len:235 (-) Transcript_15609:1246-1950(-)